MSKFKDQIGYIVGGQNANVRQRDIDDFNADKKRIMVINIKAGGVGISLHDLHGKHARASIISPNFSAFELVQALGRVWRQGGLTKSYQILYSPPVRLKKVLVTECNFVSIICQR